MRRKRLARAHGPEIQIGFPADQRQAVELRHLQGLAVLEIGQRMGRSTAAVGGLLQRGLKSLRGMLDDSS